MTQDTVKQQTEFIGRAYKRTDTGEVVRVMRGIGDLWIAGVVKPNGSKKRVKTADVPACSDPEDCQKFLDAYAKKKGWESTNISIKPTKTPRECKCRNFIPVKTSGWNRKTGRAEFALMCMICGRASEGGSPDECIENWNRDNAEDETNERTSGKTE